MSCCFTAARPRAEAREGSRSALLRTARGAARGRAVRGAGDARLAVARACRRRRGKRPNRRPWVDRLFSFGTGGAYRPGGPPGERGRAARAPPPGAGTRPFGPAADAPDLRVPGGAAEHSHRRLRPSVGGGVLHRGAAEGALARRAAGRARARAGPRDPARRRGLILVGRARVARRDLPADGPAAAALRVPGRSRVRRRYRRRAAHRGADGAGKRAAQDRLRYGCPAAATARTAGGRQPPDDRLPVPAPPVRTAAALPPAHRRAGTQAGRAGGRGGPRSALAAGAPETWTRVPVVLAVVDEL